MDSIIGNFSDQLVIEDLIDIIGDEEIYRMAKFKKIFDLLPCGVEVLDEKGVVVVCNKADREIFGVNEDAFEDFNNFNDPNVSDEILQEVYKGNAFNVLITYDFSKITYSSIYKDCIKYLSVRGIPLYTKHQTIKGYFVVIVDDTLHHQQHAILEDSFTKLQVAINTGNSIIWEYDVVNNQVFIDPILNNCKDNSLLQFISRISFQNKEKFYESIHPEDLARIRDCYLEPLLNGGITHYTTTYRRVIGDEVMWIRVNARGFKYNENKKPAKVIFYASDITQEIQLENSLINLERESYQILNAIPDLIFVISNEYKFQKVFASGTKSKGLYLSEKDTIGKSIDDIFDPEKALFFKEKVNIALKDNVETEFDYSLQINGKQCFFESRISPLEDGSSMHIVRDITDIIVQQDEINRLNAIMDIILSNVPLVVSVKNVSDNFKYVYFNSEAEHVMNRRAKDILGKTDFDLFPDQTWASEIRNKDLKAIAEGRLSEYAVNYKDPSGKIRIVNALRTRVQSKNEVYLVAMLWDITEQHNNELELIKARESDRLKTNFLANISHEIRTPLNAIIGFASIVGDANDEFERDYYLNIINENSNQLLKLIDDIIDLSSLEVDKFEFKMRSVELKDICRSVYNMFSQKTKPEVSFIFDDNILPSVFLYTDPKRLHQVLSNLIDNSVKFTNKGSIRFGYEIQSEENTDKQFVRIYVEDTGIGIDKNYNHVLFDRFFKADNFTQGFGLGLPIAKKLTEEMGGELKFTSEIGLGSKFWIKIPIQSNS